VIINIIIIIIGWLDWRRSRLAIQFIGTTS